MALDFPDRIQDEVGFLHNAVEFRQVRLQLSQPGIAVRGEFREIMWPVQYVLDDAKKLLEAETRIPLRG